MTMANGENVHKFPLGSKNQPKNAHVVPERITEARKSARYTQSDLARLLGISRQSISSYELGNKSPDPHTLSIIANVLGQPIFYFTKKQRHDFGKHSVKFFRKVGSDTKKRNQACNVLAGWLSQSAYYLSQEVNTPNVNVPQYEPKDKNNNVYTEEEIEHIAEEVRGAFGLGVGPISNVVRLLEKNGIFVSRYEIKGENIEAFSFWSGDIPFIFLASEKDSAVRARFDAAHELGHLCMHSWIGEEEIEDKERLKVIESEANRFAGAFLLPRKSFPCEVFSPRADAFIELKRRWKVAIQAMIYRCKDLEIFDDKQITNLYKQISYKKWKSTEPLDRGREGIEFEQPALLPRVVDVVLKNGQKSPDEVVWGIGLDKDILERLLGLAEGTLESETQLEEFPEVRY